MSEIRELSTEEVAFLAPFMPTPNNYYNNNNDLPFVTLTWAQSLDGKIAIAQGARTTLSCTDSKSMTHYLRKCHDAILVGSVTATVDDPSLNCRYPGVTKDEQPQPIILDQSMRWWDTATKSKVYKLATANEGKYPMRISARMPFGPDVVDEDNIENESNGIISLYVPDPEQPMSWTAILKALKRNGCTSVMIEGGGATIQELLSRRYCHLISSVIITIAPTFLGQDGVTISPFAEFSDKEKKHPINVSWINNTKTHAFGNDTVMCGYLSPEYSAAPPASPPKSFEMTMR